MNDSTLINFLNIIKMIYEQSVILEKIKSIASSVAKTDAIKTKEEEEKVIKAVYSLNQKKFQIITETQSLYSMIVSMNN